MTEMGLTVTRPGLWSPLTGGHIGGQDQDQATAPLSLITDSLGRVRHRAAGRLGRDVCGENRFDSLLPAATPLTAGHAYQNSQTRVIQMTHVPKFEIFWNCQTYFVLDSLLHVHLNCQTLVILDTIMTHVPPLHQLSMSRFLTSWL